MKQYLHHIRTLLFVAMAALSLQCQEKGTFNPVGPPVKTYEIDGLTASPNRVSAGGGECEVSGRVIDQDDDPHAGARVTFQALRGAIDEADTTDQTGAFSARYVAGDTPGTDTITVSIEETTAFVVVTLTGASADLTLQLNSLSILANGIDTTLVTATLVGRSGPINRIPVRFETTAGTFTGQRLTYSQTDIDGRAFAVITSASSRSSLTATITATVGDVETISLIPENSDQLPGDSRQRAKFRTHSPASEDAEASIPVTFRGVGISVEASPEQIPGDGQAVSEIRAFVKEENNQAVPNARVTFSARLGSIPVQALTDAAGVAKVNLTSATLPGVSDRVVVRYGPVLADSVEVTYAAAVGRIALSAQSPSFLANGVNGLEITAQVFGGTGSAAPGVEVQFSTDGGSIFPERAVTDNTGKAVTTLFSPGSLDDVLITVRGEVVENGFSSTSEVSVPENSSLTAKTVGLNSQSERSIRRGNGGNSPVGIIHRDDQSSVIKPAQSIPVDDRGSVVGTLDLTSQVTVMARGVQLRLSVDPDSVVARPRSTSSLTARVFETTSGNPVPGDTVRFATTLGSVPGSAILDADGSARTTFTAGDEVGTAIIAVRYGSMHRTEASIEVLPLIGQLSLRSDLVSIRAGGIESATVTAQLNDPLGNPAPGISISFSADHLPGETSRKITDANGNASFVVASPAVEADSAFRITASAGDLTEVLRVGVRAVSRLISADPDSLSSGSNQQVTITFQAFETTTRRPVTSDTIWFSAAGGVVQPFAILSGEGVAVTTFRVGNQPGSAAVSGQLGLLSPDTTRLTLVEPVNSIVLRTTRRSILSNGVDTTLVSASVTNILGQPSPNVWVSFRANFGTVTPEAVRTDANGFAQVQFLSHADHRDRQGEIIAVVETEAVVQANNLAPGQSNPAAPKPLRFLRGIPALANEPVAKMATGALSDQSAGNFPKLLNDNTGREFSSESNFTGFDEVSDTVFVETRGVTLSLYSSTNAIRADGRSRAGINIQLTESTTGSAIAGASLRIGATRGAIAAAGVTGNDGTYRDSLTAGIVPGVCVVRATYGDLIVASDSLEFTPDPARQNLIFQLDQAEAIAGSGEQIRLMGRIVDNNGLPSSNIDIVFTQEGSFWVLVDPDEYREVSRYENTFRVENRENVASIRLIAQLRGVESARTQFYINRVLIENVALPRDDLWGEYTFTLPVNNLLDDVNRLEVVGGNDGGVSDRFSIASIRLGLIGSHAVGEGTTDENGVFEELWTVGRVTGVVTFRAALADAPERFVQRTLRLYPDIPASIRLSTSADTLLANGAEESPVLALAVDANGNPVSSGIRVVFSAEEGDIQPGEVETLGDGTASAVYSSPASEQDIQAELTASSDDAEGTWSVLLRGARLRLTVPDARLLADGNSRMEIRARLSTADGAAVAGRRIDFVTTRGSITPTAQTGDDGVAIAVLTAADVADTAQITASFGPEITDRAEVIFAPLIDQITLSVEPESIRADGQDSAAVTISAVDGLGAGASGVRVDIDSDRGRLSSHRVITGQNGTAVIRVFGAALASDDSLRIVATTSDGTYRDTVYVRLRGISFSLRSDQDSLAANGVATARITANVVETSSGNAVTAGRINFSTDLGGITASANLNENGQAFAVYTAATSVGNATLRAVFGNSLTASDTILLVDRVADLNLTATPQRLLANGAQTARIIVRVTDSWGEGAPQEQVTINFEGAGVVSPNVGITNANGEFVALARGFASGSDGRLLVTASIRGGRFTETVPIDLRGVNLEVEADPGLIAGDGRSEAAITARLRESSSGHPVVNDTIRFYTTAGTIVPFVITDQNGETVVNLRSDPRPAIAMVTAEYGNRLADSVRVAFAGRFSFLNGTVERATLLADGIDSTAVTATALDTLGRPIAGITVFYSSLENFGSLSADSANTNENGNAVVYWRGEASTVDLTGRIRIYAGAVSDTVRLALRGLTLTLATSRDTISANGVAESQMTASVRETERGNPVIGRTVFFRTSAGVIPVSGVLDENGEATVNLRAGAQPGSATVTAEFGDRLSAERRVVFIPTVGTLTLTTGRARLLADGVDTTLIRMRLVDGVNNAAPNVRINLTAPNGGQIEPAQVVTDGDGFAVAVYRSFASATDSSVLVTGVATGGAAAQTSLSLTGVTIQLRAIPDRLSANGRAVSQISATLFESIRHTPIIGRNVYFSADRGRITGSAETDDDGIAGAVFTAPDVAGMASIVAGFGDTLETSLTINCQASIAATAGIVVDPEEISVAGVGRNERAVVTAEIRDTNGELVVDNSEIVLRISPNLGLQFENDRDTIVVRTSQGIATANVRAGSIPGTVSFIVRSGGRTLAQGGALTIRSGPPARLRVRPDISTIHFPAGGFTAFPVSAGVNDRFGNPVEDGTVVRFRLNPDTTASISPEGRTLGGIVSTPLEPIDYPTGVWLTYSDDEAGEEIWIIASSGENAIDSVQVILPGDLEGGEPARMEVGFDRASLVADGQSTSLLTINLVDADNLPVADMTEVELSSTLGLIQTPRFTARGLATATYRAGRVAGIDTIRIVAGNISDQITMRLSPGDPEHLTISAQRDRIRANGVDNTPISVRVFDRFDNPVQPGTAVTFTTTLGTIEPEAETDNDGFVSILLTSGVRTGAAVVRAAAGDVDVVTIVTFESGEPTNVVLLGSDRQAIGIRGSGIAETATIRFEVRDDRGVAVDSTHNAWVRFRLDGPAKVIDPDSSSADSVATLQPDSALTDALGQVSVSLRSGYFAGAVEVTGRIGDGIAGRAISVAIRGGAPDQDHFTIESNRCVTTGIYGTPVDTTLITVTLGDRFSNPVTPGTVVRFRATGGVVEGSAVTDTLGRASVLLRTTQPWPEEGVDTIEAQTVDYLNREIRTKTAVLVTGPTIAVFDTLDGWEIPFGSFRDFTVTVADTFAHSLSAGTSIALIATALDERGGALEGLVLTGPGTADPVVLGECDFRSEFNIRLFNYISGLDVSDLTLTATITSPNGNREVSSHGFGQPQALSTELSRVQLNPAEIVADGEEECQIRLTLYDTLGVAIQNVLPDYVDISAIGGDAIVTQPTDNSDGFGRMTASLVGRAVGQSRIETRVQGTLLEEQPILTLVAGPPVMMSVQVLDRRLVVGGDTTTIVVDISDVNGNPTADGTVVTFEVDDGTLTPASTTTTNGRALTVLSSGITAGEVQLTIRASRRGVTVIGILGNIEYIAGPPSFVTVTAPNYSVIVGTQSTITISAVDEFGNAVSGGVAFDLEVVPAGNGQISPASVETDSTGVAEATFTSGTVAGAQARVTAESGDISGQSSQFTFLPGLPGRLTLVADPESQQVGEDISLTATVVDAYGNTVSDSTRVTFTKDPARGVLSPSAIRTTNGIARSNFTGVVEAGNVEVSATASDVSASALVTFTVGPLNSVSVESQPNAVLIGNSSTITATAIDEYGNPIANLNLNFEISTNPGGTCRLQNAERRTNGEGSATTVFTAGQTAGSAIITVFFDEDGNNALDEDEINSSTFVDIAQ